MPTQEMLRRIVCDDLDPAFVRSVSIEIGWKYRSLYETISQMPFLTDAYRIELFNRQRGDVVSQAMISAARQHGVPFQLLRLANGQHKVLIKTRRVVLISEAIRSVEDRPHAADYKLHLSEVHGYLRQLELDLRDQPYMVRDWSGSVLATLLHGPVGSSFKKSDRDLGVLLLGVADAAYSQWVLRLDLHDIAMFGSHTPTAKAKRRRLEGGLQSDNVVVRLRRRTKESGAG